MAPTDLFFHALAILHTPAYRAENTGTLRMDWPRIPWPNTKTSLATSAALGRALTIDEADHFTTMARRIAALYQVAYKEINDHHQDTKKR